jgi:hypothetical protein
MAFVYPFSAAEFEARALEYESRELPLSQSAQFGSSSLKKMSMATGKQSSGVSNGVPANSLQLRRRESYIYFFFINFGLIIGVIIKI